MGEKGVIFAGFSFLDEAYSRVGLMIALQIAISTFISLFLYTPFCCLSALIMINVFLCACVAMLCMYILSLMLGSETLDVLLWVVLCCLSLLTDGYCKCKLSCLDLSLGCSAVSRLKL